MKQKIVVPRIQSVIDECLPLFRTIAKGRCAISIGGSHGKGNYDDRSDVDFRVFCDDVASSPHYSETKEWKQFLAAIENWRARGIHIDGCWIRTVGEIESKLNAWLDGTGHPEELVWSLWGYHLLTDLANQMILDDPSGLIASWQERLACYPRLLQRTIIEKHLSSLRYWRTDYHYRSKVDRGDVVFLASMAARLTHDMLQIIFAINEVYYIGDGNNLSYITKFKIQPVDFAQRVKAALYPSQSDSMFVNQYEILMSLIDDTCTLASKVYRDEKDAVPNGVKIRAF